MMGNETFMPNRAIWNGQTTQSSTADNATATATLAAINNNGQRGRYFLTGIEAHYSAAVALIKSVTITYTPIPPNSSAAVTFSLPWDFTNGDLIIGFPGVIACLEGTAVTATLEASGTGGKTGQVSIWYFT